MRWRVSVAPALLAAASAVALWPALAQRAPESILPPGFGQPEATPTPTPPPSKGDTSRPEPSENDVPDIALTPPPAPVRGDAIGDVIETLGDNEAVAIAPLDDLPPYARRSLDRVGLLARDDGGLDETSFGTLDGRFLSSVLRSIDAPIASRWGSILLRRALLSPSAVPPGINGADWVAERAWLLLRMGEADMARALVARVDVENFTPKLYQVAMQAALATGDPASVCPYADAGASSSDEPSWPLAQAMCAGLSGESGTASALIDRVRDRRQARGVDVLLAEKVIGAGSNTRRAVNIQWDGVDQLTAWRFGLATATGLAVPAQLYATAGPQVQAWLARAPLIASAQRANAVERAAELGVVSTAALVDFYASLWDATDPADRGTSIADRLRTAYAGSGDAARRSAIVALWGSEPVVPYARLLMTARAAATIAPDGGDAASNDRLVAAMLSAGLDIQAARYAERATLGEYGKALLAVGAPRPVTGFGTSEIRSAETSADTRRAEFVLAGLAGLGRLPADDASNLAERYGVPLGRASSWTRALDRAAAANEAAAVVLIAVAGLQTREWRYVPPAHLYHIVAALRRVGLEPEARMIAAEAVTRS